MVSIDWCLRQTKGLRVVEPNENMSNSYLRMAEESVKEIKDISSKIWSVSISYYIFYYSLYSFMLRLGIKSEMHACSIEFMKKYLNDYYSIKDISMFEKAFSARIDIQYYSDRLVDEEILDEIKNYSFDFYVKTKDILNSLSEEDIKLIRRKLE